MVRMRRTLALTGSQAFAVYGLHPRRTLTWTVVHENDRLSMRTLLDAGITEQQLKTLQPDLAVWLHTKKIALSDLGALHDWSINLVDAVPDLAVEDIISLAHKMSAARLRDLGITFKLLRTRYALQWTHLLLFPYSLHDWFALGLSWDEDISFMQPGTFAMVFKTSLSDGYTAYTQWAAKHANETK